MSGDAGSMRPESRPLIPSEIFRAYDIRGVSGSQLTPQVVQFIGQGIGSEALDQGIDTLLLARDGRLSSPELIEALKAGVTSSGCNTVDLGIVPTPLMYFATHTTPWSSGLMLTASHNPADYNGIKIVFKHSCLADNQIQQIKQRIEAGELKEGYGTCDFQDIMPAYLEEVCQRVQLKRKLKIAIDCANGVTSVIARKLFEKLGCEVIPLYCELDGSFPNHEPDPTQTENLRDLQALVVEHNADIGLAFDGDGDRLALVSNTGEPIDTDQLLAALIKSILPNHAGEKVIFDVKCSSRLAPLIESCGGVPIMHRSGHSFMKQKMQETGAPVGGEFSAHIFIKDRWYGFDDGLYTAARVLEILSQSGKDSTSLFDSLGQRSATGELKVEVDEGRKFALAASLQESADFPDGRVTFIDGVRVDFDDGWGLVRASNTSPALLLRFEADSTQSLEKIQALFKQFLLSVDESLPINF